MNYLFGFRTSCEFMAIILIVYSFIFYIFTRKYVNKARVPTNITRNDINTLDVLKAEVQSNNLDEIKSAENMVD